MKPKAKPVRKRAQKAEAKAPAASVTAKRKRGGQQKYETPELLADAIESYFNDPDCDFTICGLALALDFCERKSLYEYAQRPGFDTHVKKAMLRVERKYEQRTHGANAGGAIFVLKNMGWSDKLEVEVDDMKTYRIAFVQS